VAVCVTVAVTFVGAAEKVTVEVDGGGVVLIVELIVCVEVTIDVEVV
jgi:hypothetical protein